MLKINELARLHLGVKGENESRTIEIDMSAWAQLYPNATVEILHKRYGDQTKALTGATYDNDTMILSWTPTDYDTFYEGYGVAEIRMVESDVVKKTKDLIVTAVCPSVIDGSGTVVPSDYQAFLNSVLTYKNQANASRMEAENAAEDAEAWAKGTRDGEDVGDTDPAYHNNAKYYAEDAADSAGDAADAQEAAEDAQEAAETAKGLAEDAQEAAETAKAAAEAALQKYPYVDTVSGNWMLWDPETSTWVNTGIHAKGDTGEVPNISVGTVTTLLPGEQATVTRRAGSPDTAPIFDFAIPKGDTGQAGNIYGNTIDMSESDTTKVATAIGTKADKVTGGTENNFAALDANGSLKDSGHKHSDYLTEHQDISGKADKVTGAISGNFAGLDANGNLTDSGSKAGDFITDKSDKADKVTGATNGNFAGLDANGNLTDSGHKHSDYLTAHQDISGKVNAGAYAIVSEGDTHDAITSGQYVYVKNHSTLADGLYTASSNIAANGTLSSSNVSAVTGGGMNVLGGQISTLNSNLIPSMLDVQNKSYTSGSIDDLPCGIYRIYNSVTQIPISVAGYCSCYVRENGTKLQVYTSDTNRTFTRTKASGTWSNWEELALNSKTTIKSEEVSALNKSALETELVTLMNALPSNGMQQAIYMKVTNGVENFMNTGSYYMGTIYKNSTGYGVVTAFHHSSNPFIIKISNGSCGWVHIGVTT